jgi:hypothetical protein
MAPVNMRTSLKIWLTVRSAPLDQAATWAWQVVASLGGAELPAGPELHAVMLSVTTTRANPAVILIFGPVGVIWPSSDPLAHLNVTS